MRGSTPPGVAVPQHGPSSPPTNSMGTPMCKNFPDAAADANCTVYHPTPSSPFDPALEPALEPAVADASAFAAAPVTAAGIARGSTWAPTAEARLPVLPLALARTHTEAPGEESATAVVLSVATQSRLSLAAQLKLIAWHSVERRAQTCTAWSQPCVAHLTWQPTSFGASSLAGH